MQRVVRVQTKTCPGFVDLESICLIYVGDSGCEWKVCFKNGHPDLILESDAGCALLEAWTDYHNGSKASFADATCSLES